MNAIKCDTCKHAKAPLPDGWVELDYFDRRVVVGQLSERLACEERRESEKPCLKPAASKGHAQAVTVHQSFRIGVPDLAGVFAVQAGIPLEQGFGELALLVSAASDAASDLAQLLGDTNPPSISAAGSLVWPIVYLLDMANALQSSMDLGLRATRGDAT